MSFRGGNISEGYRPSITLCIILIQHFVKALSSGETGVYIIYQIGETSVRIFC